MTFLASIDQLNKFAREFWNSVPNAKVFAFHGEMGAGKTTLITALCKQKGVTDVISSPTFSIINEYPYEENGEKRKIYHIDLYRLNSMEEVIQTGVEDCLYSGEICLVEWPEKAPELLNEDAIHVFIEPVSETNRKIEVEAVKNIRQ